MGQQFGLDTLMPVDDDGRFMETVPHFAGMDTDEANPHIIDWLRERGTLVARKDISHSYPHCWRCHEPVIFRATDQWFVSMEKTGLREAALDQIHNHVDLVSFLGRRTASERWSPTVPTGASRASATGACRSRCSSAPSAARSSPPQRRSTR